jgi:hypothetical protein
MQIERAIESQQSIAMIIVHGDDRNIEVSKAMAAEVANTRRPLSLTVRSTV